MSKLEILLSVPKGRLLIAAVLILAAMEALLVAGLAASFFTEEKEVTV